MKTSTVIVGMIAFVLMPFVLLAGTINVGPGGDYAAIQEAIDAAVNGDEIIVAPGTYKENIQFKDKNIILRSTDPTDSSVVEQTIIDGDGKGSVVCFGGKETNACQLAGFTIRNGFSRKGGGIRGNGTHATIKNNHITKNTAKTMEGMGGGLHECNGPILLNIISENTADGDYNPRTRGYGGGLYDCDGDIVNNIIVNNRAESSGYGFLIRFVPSHGSADARGGGLYECNGRIRNNVIKGNSVLAFATEYPYLVELHESGGGLEDCGTITNCIVRGNSIESTSPYYCCVDTEVGGDLNITEDPELTSDYHLKPSSPCIDAGEYSGKADDDIDGDARPFFSVLWEKRGDGSGYDIGVDEYIGIVSPNTTPTPTPSPSPTPILVPSHAGTIQEAIDAAVDGQEIIVSPGTYRENISFKGKNIILRSIDPENPELVKTTIIDGNNYGSVVTFQGFEDSSCILAGFFITNGNATSSFNNYSGGGINGNGAGAVIRSNVIASNIASRNGGGIAFLDGPIEANVIRDNNAANGGGLYECSKSFMDHISNNVISGNQASIYGGGLHSCGGIIENCIIQGNTAEKEGGGLYECGSLINNAIFGNSSNLGAGGVYRCYQVINCIIWNNISPNHAQILQSDKPEPEFCCIQDWISGGTCNTSADPRLVSPGEGDFHLQKDSPCIDAGMYSSKISLLDPDGDPRGFDGDGKGAAGTGDGSDFDIGVDEFTPPFHYRFDFENPGSEGWEPFPMAPGSYVDDPIFPFYVAPATTGDSTIIIDNVSGDDNTYGSWQQKTSSPLEAMPWNYLYRVDFILETDQTDPDKVPQIRFRWNDVSSLSMVGFYMNHGPNAPGDLPTEYSSYYYKPSQDSILGIDHLLYLDMVDFTPGQSGRIACDFMEVTRLDPPESGELMARWDTGWDFIDWNFFRAKDLDPAEKGRRFEGNWLETPREMGAKSLTYGGWSSPNDSKIPSFEPGYLYEAVFTLKSSIERQFLPMIRLRFSNWSFDWMGTREIRRVPGAYFHMPSHEGTRYRIFLEPPPYLSGKAGDPPDSMALNFDVVDGSPEEWGRITLIMAEIYRHPLP